MTPMTRRHFVGRLLGILLVLAALLGLFAAMFALAGTHPWAVPVLAFVGLILLGYAGGGLK